jgi:hypothetical protein
MQLLIQDGRPIELLASAARCFILKHRTLLIFFISHTEAAPLVSETHKYLDFAAFPPKEMETAAAVATELDFELD